MSTLQQQILEEMRTELEDWFDTQSRRDDLASIKQRTTLQMGVFREITVKYQPGRTTILDLDLDFDEPISSRRMELPSREQILGEVLPGLAAAAQQRLDQLADTPLIDYRFRLRAKIRAIEGMLQFDVLEYVHAKKKAQLLDNIHAFIATRLQAGAPPTDPLETMFLSRHLLDPHLFPVLDVGWTIARFGQIQLVNKPAPESLAEHRGDMIHAVKDWAERQFLPRYFDVRQSSYGPNDYALKPGAALDGEGSEQIDLLLYGAVMILRLEPSYSKSTGVTFINLAKQLGSSRAARMLKEGSGSIAPDAIALDSPELACAANDVFATVHITIRQEGAGAYGQALAFLVRLLGLGFPKSYQIKLKSGVKQYLAVKGLARSDTHRFFANALAYPELQPPLEQYARAAIEEFEMYADTEGEKNCMPGTYATFGLALANTHYFSLVQDYMAVVDEEHQSVQDGFTAAFAAQYGLTAASAPVLVACLRRCTDHLKLKLLPELDDDDKLALLCEAMRGLDDHEVERVIYPVWGKLEKLGALARKASGRRKQLLLDILTAS